ncbi:hypothetical protein RF11_05690 [Thelohanellus kitauei]|uniref:Uncharacterized protein n=1 Tax=Thelohanellus kitauei TaxID=669202 RepID=A0A0C2NH50_THEKT|nr:hypothetical protein RF11_05690 [Thelohanellus kitauei]
MYIIIKCWPSEILEKTSVRKMQNSPVLYHPNNSILCINRVICIAASILIFRPLEFKTTVVARFPHMAPPNVPLKCRLKPVWSIYIESKHLNEKLELCKRQYLTSSCCENVCLFLMWSGVFMDIGILLPNLKCMLNFFKLIEMAFSMTTNWNDSKSIALSCFRVRNAFSSKPVFRNSS